MSTAKLIVRLLFLPLIFIAKCIALLVVWLMEDDATIKKTYFVCTDCGRATAVEQLNGGKGNE